MTSNLKTAFLLILLSSLILLLGASFGGKSGLYIAFFFALIMNIGSYWFSDRIVLAAYHAKEVSPAEAPMLHKMVEELARTAGIPKPRVCVIPDSSPNAFATGRNPHHAVVAVTEGLLRILSPDELRGVLAHEIGHVVNRDILIQTVAGVMATVVMYLAHMMQWAAIFGGGRDSDDNRGGGIIGLLVGIIIAPIAASLIQFAISRSREYLADETAAKLCRNPRALASALQKLTKQVERQPLHEGNEATAHLFIVNPFSSKLRGLFSTHPPVEERIDRLMKMHF